MQVTCSGVVDLKTLVESEPSFFLLRFLLLFLFLLFFLFLLLPMMFVLWELKAVGSVPPFIETFLVSSVLYSGI